MAPTKVKVRLKLQDSDGPAGETVWAEPTGEDRYRLQNSPFAAYGYAEGDIVRCIWQDGWLEVVSTVSDSGNGTIRLLFRDARSPAAQYILNELVSVGCTYETASRQLVAVTVPPTLAVPFSQLCNFLNGTEDSVLSGWEIVKHVADSDE